MLVPPGLLLGLRLVCPLLLHWPLASPAVSSPPLLFPSAVIGASLTRESDCVASSLPVLELPIGPSLREKWRALSTQNLHVKGRSSIPYRSKKQEQPNPQTDKGEARRNTSILWNIIQP